MAVTFMWPVEPKRKISEFRQARVDNLSLDIAESGSRLIYATAEGVVSRSYLSATDGECMMIEHEVNGEIWESVYAHMRSGSREVVDGDTVTQGQPIGIMGKTGNSTEQHLHFELHKGNWNIRKSNAVDPLKYLEKDLTTLNSDDNHYTVKEGDTLNNIAEKYHTTVEAIATLNNLQPDSNLKPGQQLQLPEENQQEEKPEAQVPDPKGLPKVLMKRGDRGDNVKQMQLALASVHFYPDKGAESDGIDGVYGIKTQDAVRRFQSIYLPNEADGIYGPNTRSKLKKLMKDDK